MDDAWGDGRAAEGEDRDEEAPVDFGPVGWDLGFGLKGAGARSTTTFSIRILGGSTLNLFPFPPRRGMAEEKKPCPAESDPTSEKCLSL